MQTKSQQDRPVKQNLHSESSLDVPPPPSGPFSPPADREAARFWSAESSAAVDLVPIQTKRPASRLEQGAPGGRALLHLRSIAGTFLGHFTKDHGIIGGEAGDDFFILHSCSFIRSNPIDQVRRRFKDLNQLRVVAGAGRTCRPAMTHLRASHRPIGEVMAMQL